MNANSVQEIPMKLTSWPIQQRTRRECLPYSTSTLPFWHFRQDPKLRRQAIFLTFHHSTAIECVKWGSAPQRDFISTQRLRKVRIKQKEIWWPTSWQFWCYPARMINSSQTPSGNGSDKTKTDVARTPPSESSHRVGASIKKNSTIDQSMYPLAISVISLDETKNRKNILFTFFDGLNLLFFFFEDHTYKCSTKQMSVYVRSAYGSECFFKSHYALCITCDRKRRVAS